MDVRTLSNDDAEALERFLVRHADSSMFLRANARRAGLEYRGEPFQATYVAAFEGTEIVGVVAHAWNGMVLPQAPDHVEVLARVCVASTARRVSGLSGELEQVNRARAALDLTDTPTTTDAAEGLFALALSGVVVPPLAAALECRPPRPAERATLVTWRLAYDIETLGASDTEEQRRRSSSYLDAQMAAGDAWVVVDGERPLSLSALNATLPDTVQLGGIYTPPVLRGRGYAKVVVAATLLAARARGATRAVLFAENPSAIRCYEALGFRRVGSYGLVLFA